MTVARGLAIVGTVSVITGLLYMLTGIQPTASGMLVGGVFDLGLAAMLAAVRGWRGTVSAPSRRTEEP